jgi:SAM-dependent methyltransferase
MTEMTLAAPVLRGGDLAKLWTEFRRGGLGRAWAQTVDSLRARAERRFDARHGLDSVAWIPVSELTVDSPSKAFANIYGPTPAWLMPRFLRSIPEADLGGFTFVDFGSGKGRAVLLAARHRFRRAVGLEFSRELHAEAEANIARFRQAGLLATPTVESIQADVLDFDLPEGPLVLYTFNPFGAAVMQPLLERIAASYRADPRPIYFVYYDSVDHALVEATGVLREIPMRALGPLRRLVMQHRARLYVARG